MYAEQLSCYFFVFLYYQIFASWILLFFCRQIFNSKVVLASPETTTDGDYAAILGVIGHEVCRHRVIT